MKIEVRHHRPAQWLLGLGRKPEVSTDFASLTDALAFVNGVPMTYTVELRYGGQTALTRKMWLGSEPGVIGAAYHISPDAPPMLYDDLNRWTAREAVEAPDPDLNRT